MRRTLFILAAFVALGIRLGAQNPYSTQGLPAKMTFDLSKEDKAALERVNRRMDEIRINELRPTVGLVLSGGGAKGSAYIGAIRFLEEMQIPIDLVVGTSMGGLIGGMYAIGYNSEEMEKVISEADWGLLITDRIDPKYLSYKQKLYKDTYLVSVPFFKALHLGAEQGEADVEASLNIVSSLPSSYAKGYNVMNLFSSLSVGYQGDVDFFSFEKPFACTAVDILSGKEVILREGDFCKALRSTMSIPAVFAPVKMDGKVLVDGGFYDVFPASYAKEMGADIIIGLDISDKSATDPDKINNLFDVISQLTIAACYQNYLINLQIPDVYVNPDVYKYSALSFDHASISDIIRIGYDAMKENEAIFDALAKKIGQKALPRDPLQKAKNIADAPIQVSQVVIEGMDAEDMQIILDRAHLDKLQNEVTRDDIEATIAKIVATGAFETVTYEIRGQNSPYELHIRCIPGAVHQLGLSARFDTEEAVALAVHLGLNTHKLSGSKLDLSGRISLNPRFDLHYAYDRPGMPTYNLSAGARYTDCDLLGGNSNIMNFAYNSFEANAYLSNMELSIFDFRLGFKDSYFNLKKSLSNTAQLPESLKQKSVNVFSTMAKFSYNTMDNSYFPSSGLRVSASYDWDIAGALSAPRIFHTISADFSGVVNVCPWLDIVQSIDIRYLFGDNIPFSHINVIGGNIRGRYVDQQIPFMGINTMIPMGSITNVVRTELRANPLQNLYLSIIANEAFGSDDMPLIATNSVFGCGVELGYNSILGPLKANIHWNNFDRRAGVYLGMGYRF